MQGRVSSEQTRKNKQSCSRLASPDPKHSLRASVRIASGVAGCKHYLEFKLRPISFLRLCAFGTHNTLW